MGTRKRWLRQQITCKEADRETTLLIEWRYSGKRRTLHGISCDNPRLHDIDNWDCKWSCWKRITKGEGSTR